MIGNESENLPCVRFEFKPREYGLMQIDFNINIRRHFSPVYLIFILSSSLCFPGCASLEGHRAFFIDVKPIYRIFMKLLRFLLPLSLFSVVMAGCNKDDVILSEPDFEAYATRVFEWTPAPGQYINDPTGGLKWPQTMTADEAASIAQSRLEKHYTVSLGAFGGYIVIGFDHSVENSGGYDFGVIGNAFDNASGSSNEPGIVYVMEDTNGNGLPDDTWYELAGSDTFASTTYRNYSVTYYRPDGDKQPVRWTDNLGTTGYVEYMGAYHSQPTYYPVWIKTDSYELTGTRLVSRTKHNGQTGNWENGACAWGYADNMGSDVIALDHFADCNRFRISDAVDSAGNKVDIRKIDFVKIQSGIMSQSGWLGEVSTEVLGVVDLHVFDAR